MRDYVHGLLVSYPCLAIRARQRAAAKSRMPYWDGEQCFGQMRLQPVTGQRDDWQMVSYLCDRCGRVAWDFTHDVRSTSEKEPS